MSHHLDQLESDHATITQLLQTHRAAPADGAQVGVQISLRIYLMILEDAISTLDALINFLKAKSEPVLDVKETEILEERAE